MMVKSDDNDHGDYDDNDDDDGLCDLFGCILVIILNI
jgi:hypothetical protein